MIREGLLDSEPVLSLPVPARWMYVTMLLQADDIGLLEATPFKLARKADVDRDRADEYLQAIADAGLVRLYTAGGKPYGFLTKFRQRLQIKRAKHPLPPAALYADDDDALKKINDIAAKTTVVQPESTGAQPRSTVAQPPEPEPEPEFSQTPIGVSSPPAAGGGLLPGIEDAVPMPPVVPPCPQRRLLALYREKCPELTQHRAETWDDSQGARDLAQRWRWVLTATREDGSRYATDTASAMAWWGRFFDTVSASDFLCGRATNFRADLTWLAKRANFDKVLNGNYVNKPGPRR